MAENGEYNRDDDEEQIDDEEIDETVSSTVHKLGQVSQYMNVGL